MKLTCTAHCYSALFSSILLWFVLVICQNKIYLIVVGVMHEAWYVCSIWSTLFKFPFEYFILWEIFLAHTWSFDLIRNLQFIIHTSGFPRILKKSLECLKFYKPMPAVQEPCTCLSNLLFSMIQTGIVHIWSVQPELY